MMFVGGGEAGEGGFSVGAAAAGACVLQKEEGRCVWVVSVLCVGEEG